jgi:S1-C subfamily serine protease
MAGLVEGDVIYKADGKSITTQDSLSKVLSGKKSGDKLKLSVAREGGSTAELTTILVSNKDVN